MLIGIEHDNRIGQDVSGIFTLDFVYQEGEVDVKDIIIENHNVPGPLRNKLPQMFPQSAKSAEIPQVIGKPPTSLALPQPPVSRPRGISLD